MIYYKIFYTNQKGGNINITLESLKFDQNETIETITLQLNKVIEKMILQNPEQWIWTHNRWK